MMDAEKDIRRLNVLGILHYVMGGVVILIASILLIQHTHYIRVLSSAPSTSYWITIYSPKPPSYMMDTIMTDPAASLLASKLHISYISSEIPSRESFGVHGTGSFVSYGTVANGLSNLWQANVVLVVGILCGLCMIISGHTLRQHKGRIFSIVVAVTGWFIVLIVYTNIVPFDQSLEGIRTAKIIVLLIHTLLLVLSLFTLNTLNKKSVNELYKPSA